MKLPEHKAKELFVAFGIPIPRGVVVQTAEEAESAAASFLLDGGADAATDAGAKIGEGKAERVVLKAQVLAGGRGKGRIYKDGKETGGGIRIVRSADEVKSEALSMIGGRLVTAQNPAGLAVNRLLVEEGVEFTSQFYLALTVDRDARCVVCIWSREGGMEIEELARSCPEKIGRLEVQLEPGWMPFHGRVVASGLGLKKEQGAAVGRIGAALFKLFVEKDCSLVEVNPLVVTCEGRLVALDAKVVIDDNALGRHPELMDQAAPFPEDEIEVEAKQAGLSYVKLNGTIGCLVNGAGLAMATMDIIKLCGAEPANFLDVGGTASEEAVKKAFTIIVSDPAVKAIFVNIFGGIMRCDVIARGIVAATSQLALKVPLIVRLEGNMVEEGKRILSESGLPIITADSMADGAQKAVEAAAGRVGAFCR